MLSLLVVWASLIGILPLLHSFVLADVPERISSVVLCRCAAMGLISGSIVRVLAHLWEEPHVHIFGCHTFLGGYSRPALRASAWANRPLAALAHTAMFALRTLCLVLAGILAEFNAGLPVRLFPVLVHLLQLRLFGDLSAQPPHCQCPSTPVPSVPAGASAAVVVPESDLRRPLTHSSGQVLPYSEAMRASAERLENALAADEEKQQRKEHVPGATDEAGGGEDGESERRSLAVDSCSSLALPCAGCVFPSALMSVSELNEVASFILHYGWAACTADVAVRLHISRRRLQCKSNGSTVEDCAPGGNRQALQLLPPSQSTILSPASPSCHFFLSSSSSSSSFPSCSCFSSPAWSSRCFPAIDVLRRLSYRRESLFFGTEYLPTQSPHFSIWGLWPQAIDKTQLAWTPQESQTSEATAARTANNKLSRREEGPLAARNNELQRPPSVHSRSVSAGALSSPFGSLLRRR
jgi:hypothetical protein